MLHALPASPDGPAQRDRRCGPHSLFVDTGTGHGLQRSLPPLLDHEMLAHLRAVSPPA